MTEAEKDKKSAPKPATPLPPTSDHAVSAEAWAVIGPDDKMRVVLLSQDADWAWIEYIATYYKWNEAVKGEDGIRRLPGYRVERVTILTESEQAEADRLLSAVVKCRAELPISLGMDIDNYLAGRKL